MCKRPAASLQDPGDYVQNTHAIAALIKNILHSPWKLSISEHALHFGNRLFNDVQTLQGHVVFHDDGG
jgi:hypothetical protein